ncbi:MAG: metallophosphoesterase family protein [Gemmiger sp.]|nr:metallophosphoesterase family protein [Gemmiger sp.]
MRIIFRNRKKPFSIIITKRVDRRCHLTYSRQKFAATALLFFIYDWGKNYLYFIGIGGNMKIAVLSDIHGNYVALERCLAYSKNIGIEKYVFLGDYVGELAFPQKTMEIIYNLKNTYECYFVRGNKEDYWIDYQANGETGWKEQDSTTGSLYYTYKNLTTKDIDFFKRLPYVDDINLPGYPTITICHGSPNSANEKLLPNSQKTFAIMEQTQNSIILCGHTHIKERIERKEKLVLNPGSVGVSLHGKGKAQFLILDSGNGNWNYTFVNQDYDVDKVIEDLYQSGLSEKAPGWCAVTINLLRTGEIAHGTVLARAMALCKQDIGYCEWPHIPEAYWKKAIAELII